MFDQLDIGGIIMPSDAAICGAPGDEGLAMRMRPFWKTPRTGKGPRRNNRIDKIVQSAPSVVTTGLVPVACKHDRWPETRGASLTLFESTGSRDKPGYDDQLGIGMERLFHDGP